MELTKAFWIGVAFGGLLGLAFGAILGALFTIRRTPGFRAIWISNTADAVFQAPLDEGGEEKEP